MVDTMDTEALAKYLEKQREIRLLNEEVETLKTNEAIHQALRIKHELEAMMADYDLSPEQLLEVLVVFFGINKPMKLTGEPQESSVDASSSEASATSDVDATTKPSQSRATSGTRTETTTSLPPSQAPSGQGRPAQKVTIRRRKSRPDPSSESSAKEQGKQSANQGEKTKVTAPKRQKSGNKGKEAQGTKSRRKKLRVYTNPHTGQEVKTRGANHRVLNEWRAQYGKEVVDQWWVEP